MQSPWPRVASCSVQLWRRVFAFIYAATFRTLERHWLTLAWSMCSQTWLFDTSVRRQGTGTETGQHHEHRMPGRRRRTCPTQNTNEAFRAKPLRNL